MSTESDLSQAVAALSDTLANPIYAPCEDATATVSLPWLVNLVVQATRVVALHVPDTTAYMSREAILTVAHKALDTGCQVRVVIRYASDTGYPDETLVTFVEKVEGGNLPIRLAACGKDDQPWQFIFADDKDEGILTLTLVSPA